ncbi:MAG: hypothetical protein AAF962_19300 [Actinomycetota bacterium]
MSHFQCIVQAGGNADIRSDQLATRLQAHHAGHYPGEEATVGWVKVQPGYFFTEGRQSTSSIIACSLAHTTTLDAREHYMRGVCDIWTEMTECTDHEVVVSVTETAPTTQE